MRIFKAGIRFIIAGLFIFTGVTHFTNEPFFMKIMPDYIPMALHRPAVLISGACEVLLGVLLAVPQTSRWAAWGLIALLIAVFPANIYAYQHSEELFDLDPKVHFWRLPLQAVMILVVYWYTRPLAPAVGYEPPHDI